MNAGEFLTLAEVGLQPQPTSMQSQYENQFAPGDLHELVANVNEPDSSPSTALPSWGAVESPTIWAYSPSSASQPFFGRRQPDDESAGVLPNLQPLAFKDVDDPTSPPEPRRGLGRESASTPTTLTRLFAVHAPISVSGSRSSSYKQSIARNYSLTKPESTPTLPTHLYSRGLLGGRHSDVNVHILGKSYALHRLILDRAPFFASALSEPWLESQEKDITLHPEEVDSNITFRAFELALKRLYGCHDAQEEEEEATSLFATGCWLEMEELVEACVDYLLRKLRPDTLASTVQLVTANYYGEAGQRILSAANAILCRDGADMPSQFWDGIPGDVVRDAIGGDTFFVKDEWERWKLASRLLTTRLLDKRFGSAARDIVKLHRDSSTPGATEPRSSYSNSIVNDPTPESENGPSTLSAQLDVEPLLELLDKDIHYCHLSFEQLQYIRQSRGALGLAAVPENIITGALWMNMELRQAVLNADDGQEDLGLSKSNTPKDESGTTRPILNTLQQDTMSVQGQPSKPELDQNQVDLERDSASLRRFDIPIQDCTMIVGGGCYTTSNSMKTIRPKCRASSTVIPGTTSNPSSFTQFPPFRFCVELPHPRLLKERRRLYSRTVFYAGSLWNIYIQKKQSSTRSEEIGVYLRRLEEEDAEQDVRPQSMSKSSVDERIGHLEREMLLRRDRRNRGRGRQLQSSATDQGDDYTSSLISALDSASITPPRLQSYHSTLLGLYHNSGVVPPEPDIGDNGAHPPAPTAPTLSSYIDTRPAVKAYFKIATFSKGGRLITVYESAPDTFSCSRGCGWTSASLTVDDLSRLESSEEGDGKPVGCQGKQLKFMVVIGVV